MKNKDLKKLKASFLTYQEISQEKGIYRWTGDSSQHILVIPFKNNLCIYWTDLDSVAPAVDSWSLRPQYRFIKVPQITLNENPNIYNPNAEFEIFFTEKYLKNSLVITL